MGTNLIPTNEIQLMALAVSKSGLFGIKTQDQAMALMLIAQAEGLHPAVAARDYNIIQGRPALKADAMMARFQSAGGKVEWTCLQDDRVVGKFTHPQGGTAEIDWDMARAKKAGLGGKENWTKWPRQMLRARVISEGIRTVFPGCVAGFYTPEEVQDFTHEEKDVTPPSAPQKPAPMPEAVKAKAAAMKAAKPGPKGNVIEGTATTVTGDSEEGDLSGIGNNKPDLEVIGKIVHAFANIGFTIETLEEEYGKKIDDWTMEDVAEAREVFKIKKAERKSILDEIAAKNDGKEQETI